MFQTTTGEGKNQKSRDEKTNRAEILFSRMRVLLVTEDEQAAGYIKTGLRRLGILCDTADTPEHGMQLAVADSRNGRYDAILVSGFFLRHDANHGFSDYIEEIFAHKTTKIIWIMQKEMTAVEEGAAGTYPADNVLHYPFLHENIYELMGALASVQAKISERMESGENDCKNKRLMLT